MEAMARSMLKPRSTTEWKHVGQGCLAACYDCREKWDIERIVNFSTKLLEGVLPEGSVLTLSARDPFHVGILWERGHLVVHRVLEERSSLFFSLEQHDCVNLSSIDLCEEDKSAIKRRPILGSRRQLPRAPGEKRVRFLVEEKMQVFDFDAIVNAVVDFFNPTNFSFKVIKIRLPC